MASVNRCNNHVLVHPTLLQSYTKSDIYPATSNRIFKRSKILHCPIQTFIIYHVGFMFLAKEPTVYLLTSTGIFCKE